MNAQVASTPSMCWLSSVTSKVGLRAHAHRTPHGCVRTPLKPTQALPVAFPACQAAPPFGSCSPTTRWRSLPARLRDCRASGAGPSPARSSFCGASAHAAHDNAARPRPAENPPPFAALATVLQAVGLPAHHQQRLEAAGGGSTPVAQVPSVSALAVASLDCWRGIKKQAGVG